MQQGHPPGGAAVAERHAADRGQPAALVAEQAAREYPHFADAIMELCRGKSPYAQPQRDRSPGNASGHRPGRPGRW